MSIAVGLGACSDGAGRAASSAEEVYTYINDSGDKVYVNDPALIPEGKRAASTAIAGPGGAEIYTYVDVNGNTLYVNDVRRIPKSLRKSVGVVDLSKIELTFTVAKSLSSAIDEQYEAALDSDYCHDAVAASKTAWLQRLWRDHNYLVILAGVFLCLVLMSPMMMRRFTPGAWGKVLMVGLPMLMFVGLFSFATVKTGHAGAALREEAAPCEHDGLDDSQEKPDIATRRAGTITRVRGRIRKAQQVHGRALDRAMQME